MSTISDAEQRQLDSTMEAQLVASEEARIKAIESGYCAKCRYPLRVIMGTSLIQFCCGDPSGVCNWKVMYPIATIGTANEDYLRGYREGFRVGEGLGR